MSQRPMGPGKAAASGAIGCLAFALLLGVCVAATGGTAYFDAGGIVFLLVAGAILGLIAYAFYSKGRRDAVGNPPGPSGGPSVDQLVAEVERDFREGRIDQAEHNRRLKLAWRGRRW